MKKRTVTDVFTVNISVRSAANIMLTASMKEKNVKVFVRDLDNLCNELDMQYNINSGYCYYVAYMIAKFCEENDIEYKFAAYIIENGTGICFHYGVKIGDVKVNQLYTDSENYKIRYINEDSKWMYRQYKENYNPKLNCYWKDYNRRYVNSEIKYMFNTYKRQWENIK